MTKKHAKEASRHATKTAVSRTTKKEKTTEKQTTKQKTPILFWPFGVFGFALLLFLDQYTKSAIRTALAQGREIDIIAFIKFTYVQNTGAVWGSIPDTNAYLVWLSVIAFGLLIFFYDQFKTTFEKIAYTLLLVGLWGNMLDRVLYGHVVDFISVGWWPVFNIADSCITVGITIYILEALRQWRQRRTVNA
ncbi:TPA: signal peptidase II [Candidatus Woesearchaeota archaeon]|nr:signal peptidase II [Candidatus Woesearchaeota archaeon]